MIVLSAGDSACTSVRFDPASGNLVVGTRSGGVASLAPHAPPTADEGAPRELGSPVHQVDVSPDGEWVAFAGAMGWMAQHSSGRRVVPGKLVRSAAGVRFVGENLVAVGFGDRNRAEAGSVELFDLATGKARTPRIPSPSGVRALTALPEAKKLAWVEWGRRLAVWKVEHVAPTYLPLPSVPADVALCPAGPFAAVATQWVVQVYDLFERRLSVELKGHKGVASSVAYSPDGGTLASGSWDGTVRFWDAAGGAERRALSTGIPKVYAVAFSPDGLQLAAAGSGGVVRVFDVD